VDRWKEICPHHAVALKRDLDEVMYGEPLRKEAPASDAAFATKPAPIPDAARPVHRRLDDVIAIALLLFLPLVLAAHLVAVGESNGAGGPREGLVKRPVALLRRPAQRGQSEGRKWGRPRIRCRPPVDPCPVSYVTARRLSGASLGGWCRTVVLGDGAGGGGPLRAVLPGPPRWAAELAFR
jgi:hypothetical protein